MQETVNVTSKQKFDGSIRSRLWWKQFHELVIKSVVHTLERNLAIHTVRTDIRDSERYRLPNTGNELVRSQILSNPSGAVGYP